MTPNNSPTELITELALFSGIQGPTFDAIKLAMNNETYTAKDYFYSLESTTLSAVDTTLGAMITLGLVAQILQHGSIYLSWNEVRFQELSFLYDSNPQFINLAGKAERDALTLTDGRHPEYLANRHRLDSWYKEKNLRIFNNPNHLQYGPVRRMWVILTQLNLLTFLDHFYSLNHGTHQWDTELAAHIAAHNQRESATFAFYLNCWLNDYTRTGELNRVTSELRD